MSKQWPDGELARRLAQPAPQGWTAQQWCTVCTVLADGGSYDQAAEDARLSKNQVIGIAHRRNFPKRESVIVPGGAAALQARERAARKAAQVEARERDRMAAAETRAAPMAVGPRAVVVLGRANVARNEAMRDSFAREREILAAEGLTSILRRESTPSTRPAPAFVRAKAVTRRNERGCQWPFGTPGEDDFRFCAAVDVVVGKPYCLDHCCIAYTRTDEERARAAEVARQVAGTPDYRPYVAPRAA